MEIIYKCMSTVEMKRGFAVLFFSGAVFNFSTFSPFCRVERGYLYEGSSPVFGWHAACFYCVCNSCGKFKLCCL